MATGVKRSVLFQGSHRRTSHVVLEDLQCSALETALKEQVYRLAGQWEQGGHTELYEVAHDQSACLLDYNITKL